MNPKLTEQEWNQIVEAAFAPDAPEPQFSARYCANRQALERRIAMKQHKKSTHKKSTGFLIAAAAACAALTGVTAAAVTGRLDLLRDVLSQTELRNGPDVPAALIDNVAEDEAPRNLAEPATLFAGDESLCISAAAMNYDSNTLMLTLALTPQEGTVLPQDALFIPYFERITEDGAQRINPSGIYAVEHLVTDAATDTAYLTYYLTQPDIAGSTLRVTLQNAYSQAQIDAVSDGIRAAQKQWRIDYGADSMSIEEWKALWQAEDLDSRTNETAAALLAESDSLLCGTWAADLEVPETDTAPLTAEADGFRVTADTLSLCTAYDKETSAYQAYIITFRDGTVLCTYTGTNEEAYLKEIGAIDGNTVYFPYSFGTENGRIHCYDAPHAVEDIAEIQVYLFDYVPDDSGAYQMHAEQHTLYTAS